VRGIGEKGGGAVERVLITRAGQGLGLEFTRQCLARGDRVFAGVRGLDLNPTLEEFARTLPGHMTLLSLDVANRDSIQTSWMRVHDEVDGLDVLINCASTGRDRSLSDDQPLGRIDPEAALETFRTNVVGPLSVTQRYLGLLQCGDRPRILNMSSRLGSLHDKVVGGLYAYSASTTALNMVTRILALDLDHAGIVVVAVDPAWVLPGDEQQDAGLTAQESVARILAFADTLQMEHSGSFFDGAGRRLEW
jgi:NAD(P)-dependent dehydrogenase (short-subunit alcohol dehydrogenase family)